MGESLRGLTQLLYSSQTSRPRKAIYSLVGLSLFVALLLGIIRKKTQSLPLSDRMILASEALYQKRITVTVTGKNMPHIAVLLLQEKIELQGRFPILDEANVSSPSRAFLPFFWIFNNKKWSMGSKKMLQYLYIYISFLLLNSYDKEKTALTLILSLY